MGHALRVAREAARALEEQGTGAVVLVGRRDALVLHDPNGLAASLVAEAKG